MEETVQKTQLNYHIVIVQLDSKESIVINVPLDMRTIPLATFL